GDAHPRAIGCPAKHGAFVTIEEVREYMMKKGVSKWKEVIKSTADTTPEGDSMGFYAVANGANPGIREVWYGKKGAFEDTNKFRGVCHKWFRKKAQAEAFIEDWKESYADVWRREVKKGLDQGLRPRDMELSIEGILYERGEDNIAEDIAKQFDTKLKLDGE
ncbi:hypothetical protein K469DRAFT_603390, partial [Zopfia rhizophila CBS 207.26]